jgi:23S rRNA (cytosine1962-C5)-methyltransferase
MDNLRILSTKAEKDYELLDSGEGDKLERFGGVVLSRPDPQALWKKRLPESEWKKAGGQFTREGEEGAWKFSNKETSIGAVGATSAAPKKWAIDFSRLKLWIKPTAFKHTGLFPEQSVNWDWMRGLISGAGDIEVLNLFAYTGGASLACAQAGAKVVHVDGSKSAITWARENAELSGLSDKPIRWILEDARVFVERDVKRGRTYQGIIMDPPAFGHGANKEIWKIEDDLIPLVDNCMRLFSPQDGGSKTAPLFFIINGYSAGYSAIAYKNLLLPLVEKFGGTIEIGELTLEESTRAGVATDSGRKLPCGIFARWER